MQPAEHDMLVALRHDLHAHPELGFEETRTAALVVERLEEAGITVHRGLGVTGVVGTLTRGNGPGRIALRADMDALAMPELTGLPYGSRNPGRMHACGHDGHTVMLLDTLDEMESARGLYASLGFVEVAPYYYNPLPGAHYLKAAL